MNSLFKRAYALRNKFDGPLGQYINRYAATMLEQGYLTRTVQTHIRVIAHFSRWLAEQQLTSQEVTTELFPMYLRFRRRRYKRHTPDHAVPSALSLMLKFLVKEGVVSEPPQAAPTPAVQIQDEFRVYLEQELGLAAATVKLHLFFIGKFLAEHFGTGPVDLSKLEPADVIDFVRQRVRSMSPEYAKSQNSALRVFLRFERYRGHLRTDLAACVLSVASRSLSTLPKAIPPNQAELLLASCDRTTSVGRRDYAIMLLLARLGLRAIEVARLRLDDLDFENGWITVHGKNNRYTQLPLPVDAGEAIVDYLRNARPASTSRVVFLRTTAPIAGLLNSSTISSVVRQAVLKTGIDAPQKGAHQFRHGLATRMLQQGSSLPEIADLLRHRSFRTTTIYAKVDLIALRALALPWPGRAI